MPVSRLNSICTSLVLNLFTYFCLSKTPVRQQSLFFISHYSYCVKKSFKKYTLSRLISRKKTHMIHISFHYFMCFIAGNDISWSPSYWWPYFYGETNLLNKAEDFAWGNVFWGLYGEGETLLWRYIFTVLKRSSELSPKSCHHHSKNKSTENLLSSSQWWPIPKNM